MVSEYEFGYPWRLEEGVGVTGARTTGSWMCVGAKCGTSERTVETLTAEPSLSSLN